MKKIVDFLKSEGFLCMLITFMICSFVGTWTGLAVTVVLLACNRFYTGQWSVYNVIGFAAGWGLAVLQHWIK